MIMLYILYSFIGLFVLALLFTIWHSFDVQRTIQALRELRYFEDRFCNSEKAGEVSTEEIVRRMSNEMNFQNQRINNLQMQISDLNDVNRKKLEKRRVKIAKRRI